MVNKLREAQDRQRIYAAVISHLAGPLRRDNWLSSRHGVPGDLVVSSTRGPPRQQWDPWLVGFLVERTGWGYRVRDVASPRLCNVSNDSFSVVRGVHPLLLLAGHQHQAYLRCCAGLRAGWRAGLFDSYQARFASCEYADRDTRDGVLYVRPHSFMGPCCPPRGPLPKGMVQPGTRGAPEAQQWHVITKHKAVPFRATSRLRARDLAAAIAEALATPYEHYAVPYSWNPDGGFGKPCSHRDADQAPGAMLVQR
jgi:hypothetical protein